MRSILIYCDVLSLLNVCHLISDGLDATAMVKINIDDVNDNAPMFKQTMYSLNLARDTERGTVIVNVEAVDRDSGSNGRITYTIISGNSERLFSVDKTSGKTQFVLSLSLSLSLQVWPTDMK